jgi:hypothetical protein
MGSGHRAAGIQRTQGLDRGEDPSSYSCLSFLLFILKKYFIVVQLLEQMAPIDVFTALDSLRAGSEEISSGLPTRAELQQWVIEHDRIEKETEIFDAGEFRKLKKFTKGM